MLDIKYDCHNKWLILPDKSQILFGFNKGCNSTSNPLPIELVKSNLLSANLVVTNYTEYYDNNCPDPPGQGCNTCSTYAQFNYKLNVDLSLVTSVTGTLKTYENNVLISTLNINNISHFSNTYSYQTYFKFKLEYNLVFTLNNGETFNVDSRVESNGQFCDLDSYTVLNQYNYPFNIIAVNLADGFYTLTVDGQTVCLQVHCEDNIMCEVYNIDCIGCKVDLDSFALLLALENCEDCCTKKIIWRNLNNNLTKCTQC